MDDYNYNYELPLGLGMALAQYPEAMMKFGQLPKEKQLEIINRTHGIESKAEMQALVRGLTDRL